MEKITTPTMRLWLPDVQGSTSRPPPGSIRKAYVSKRESYHSIFKLKIVIPESGRSTVVHAVVWANKYEHSYCSEYEQIRFPHNRVDSVSYLELEANSRTRRHRRPRHPPHFPMISSSPVPAPHPPSTSGSGFAPFPRPSHSWFWLRAARCPWCWPPRPCSPARPPARRTLAWGGPAAVGMCPVNRPVLTSISNVGASQWRLGRLSVTRPNRTNRSRFNRFMPAPFAEKMDPKK